MLVSQHKYKWIILQYALMCFLTPKAHLYFYRTYGNSQQDIKWVRCHEGEIGITTCKYRLAANAWKDTFSEAKQNLKSRVVRIIHIIQER